MITPATTSNGTTGMGSDGGGTDLRYRRVACGRKPGLSGRGDERGFVFLFGALALVSLLAFVGLSVDVGYDQVMKLRAQAAADAATTAGLFEIKRGATNADVIAAAKHDAALNGFTDGVNNTTVTVNYPPTSGNYSGESKGVEVIVTRTAPAFFLSLVKTNATISLKGYAAGKASSNLACVYALNKTKSRAINISSSTVNFNCGVVVESNSSTAYHMEGSGNAIVASGSKIGVVGPSACAASSPAPTSGCGFDLIGGNNICVQGGSCPTGSPPTENKITDPGDPLASYADISMTGLTKYAATSAWDMNHVPAGNQFQPGIYCGGLTVNNTNGVTYTMNPGVYVMGGGGFVMNSGSRVTGTGVTIYLTNGATSTCGSTAFGVMTLSASQSITLTAPTTGTHAGILFFQDRAQGTTSDVHQINGGAVANLNVALYFRNSQFTMSMAGSSTGYQVIVADSLTINGNSSFYLTNSPLGGGGGPRYRRWGNKGTGETR
jgi:hypothetical protein